jgi:rhamnogalacturonan endolyase
MKTHIYLLIICTLPVLGFSIHVSETPPREKSSYKRGKLLFKDNFNRRLNNWVSEYKKSDVSEIKVKNRKLLIDVDGGATVWYKRKLSGDIMITYKRRVLVQQGRNDRLSDLNQFWMATDPRNPNLFTRNGTFTAYDSLSLYYAGLGGNSNTTTRFRKYSGIGERKLYRDLTNKAHLLEANKWYQIRIIVFQGLTRFYVDDQLFFSFEDPQPLKEGYFGFRTTESRQEIDDFKVYALKSGAKK